MQMPNNSVNVSVIMAVHAGVRLDYFRESVISILNQNFESFELIVIADGSLNEQQNAYIESVLSKTDNVKLIQLTKNQGPGAARNHGIKQARGKYLAIMDSDDISFPDRLRFEYNYLNEHPDIVVVGSACEEIDENGVVHGLRMLPDSPKNIAKYALFFCPLNNPTVMGHTAIFQSYLYDSNDRNGEDYRLWLRLIKDGKKLANITRPLLKFRTDEELYKKRVGFMHAQSDFMNRIYALKIAPFYLVPIVFFSGVGIFLIRFLPPKVISVLINSLNRIRSQYLRPGKRI